jgi:glycosyltransferase involved in cell wall biosynthesis
VTTPVECETKKDAQMYHVQDTSTQIAQPCISVIMSVYNAEQYITEAIESILNQTFTNFEFIIIDDGSTDGTSAIIKNIAKIDRRIKFVSRENKGLIFSLNECLCMASGQYIARMDADDISVKTRLQKQKEFLDAHPEIGVCGTWVEVFGEEIKVKKWKLPKDNSSLKAILLFSVPFAHPSVMMRKDLIDKHHLRYNYRCKNAEDYQFWLDFARYTSFANLPEFLLRYRYHQDSVSRVADINNEQERFDIISNIQSKVLDLISVNLSLEQKRLHYALASNERLIRSELSFEDMLAYFTYIFSTCKNSQMISLVDIRNAFSYKYAVFILITLKVRRKLKITSMMKIYFLRGIIQIIKRKFL